MFLATRVHINSDWYWVKVLTSKHTIGMSYLWTPLTTASVDMTIVSDDKSKTGEYKFTFLPGFRTDGMSVPFIFQWFIKSWSEERPLYSACGALHDGLYATAGLNGYFSRNQCDTIFENMLDCVGEHDKAPVAHWCLKHFAASHWNVDEYHCSHLFLGYRKIPNTTCYRLI